MGQNNRDSTAGEGPWQNIPNGNTNTAWNYAFLRGDGANDDCESQSVKLLNFRFTSLQRYGYGRIYMALAISVQNTQGVWQTPVVMEETFRLVKEHEGTCV